MLRHGLMTYSRDSSDIQKLRVQFLYKPVPVAARSKPRTAFDRSNTGIVGSNPTRDVDLCPCFSVFCSPVQVEVLRRADPPPKESYQNVQTDS
jgi:hypothetical protein